MKHFYYAVRTSAGLLQEGELEAEDPRDAARILRAQQLFTIRLKEKKAQGKWLDFLHRNGNTKYAAFFCRQLSVMMDEQPLHEILTALAKQKGDHRYQELLQQIRQDLELGKSLPEAMQNHPDIFSSTAVHLVAAGQESGNLAEILDRLSGFLEQQYAARQKLGASMLYPLLLGILSLIAVTFLILFILPVFSELFEGMQLELPLPTRILVALGSFAGNYGLYLIPVLFMIPPLLLWLYSREPLRLQIDRLLLRLPLLGKLKQYTEWMHLLGTLGILLEGGLRIDAALAMLQSATENRYLQDFLLRLKESVSHGYPLAHLLEDCPVFPPMLPELISAGESSGRLEEMLRKCAEYCSLNAENLSHRLQSLAEPAMLLFLGGAVMLFVLSIVLPLLESMDQVSRF